MRWLLLLAAVIAAAVLLLADINPPEYEHCTLRDFRQDCR